MAEPFIILFVNDPAASAAFYAARLGREPVELSPTFGMFVLEGGAKLGLWSRHTAEPLPTAGPGAMELGLPVGSPAEVDARARAWEVEGVTLLQRPTDMDFGRTFLAADPDGHRIRVFSPT